ncbi:hypothetical protein H4S04_009295 [Coemansia sp. S16]|nr:hypothetical protein H4S04_009295 [Coemansia sp. S16]
MTGAELAVASMKILRAPIPAELVPQPVLLTGSQAELPAAMEAEPRQAGRLRETLQEVLTTRAETRRAWTRQVGQPLEQTWETRVELPLVPILISVALAELPLAPIPTLVTLVLLLVTLVLLLLQLLVTLVLLLLQLLVTLVLLLLQLLVTLVLLLLQLLVTLVLLLLLLLVTLVLLLPQLLVMLVLVLREQACLLLPHRQPANEA